MITYYFIHARKYFITSIQEKKNSRRKFRRSKFQQVLYQYNLLKQVIKSQSKGKKAT